AIEPASGRTIPVEAAGRRTIPVEAPAARAIARIARRAGSTIATVRPVAPGTLLVHACLHPPPANRRTVHALDHLLGHPLLDLHHRVLLAHVDATHLVARDAAFIDDGPDDVARPGVVHLAHIDEHLRHRPGRSRRGSRLCSRYPR